MLFVVVVVIFCSREFSTKNTSLRMHFVCTGYIYLCIYITFIYMCNKIKIERKKTRKLIVMLYVLLMLLCLCFWFLFLLINRKKGKPEHWKLCYCIATREREKATRRSITILCCTNFLLVRVCYHRSSCRCRPKRPPP